MKIIIDKRERAIIREIEKRKLDYDEKQLVIADFIIGNIGIERKTQNDLINSIIDKRLINQIIILKENFDIPLLIIEGSENIYEMRNFHPNAIRGMFASIALDYKVPIIYTKNYKDTVSFLEIILKRLEKGIKPISLLKRKKGFTLKEQQIYLIESLPGVGPTIAKNLLKKFKTIKNIINADEEELLKIDKLGPIKIKLIKKIIEKKYH